MSVLFITSFNDRLYKVTGKKCLETFYQTKSEGDILVGLEGESLSQTVEEDWGWKVLTTQVDRFHYWWANHIFQKYRSNIDVKYGGKRRNWGKSKEDGFNKNWYRWAYKIFTLRKAMEYYPSYDYYVLLDCDVEFKTQVTEQLINYVAKDYSMTYMLGPQRTKINQGIENCFTVFAGNGGRALLKDYFHIWDSGEALTYPRWDDGHNMKTFLENKKGMYKVKDVIGPHKLEQYAPVVKYSPWAPYVSHDKKGWHQRKYGVV